MQLFINVYAWCFSGVKITGGNLGSNCYSTCTIMGDGTKCITASSVINNNSFISLDHNNDYFAQTLFSCASGFEDSQPKLYFTNAELEKLECNKFVRAVDSNIHPGVLNIQVCGKLNTSTEGVYTCILKNSSMMNQSVSVGIYFSGRSKSLHNDQLFVKLILLHSCSSNYCFQTFGIVKFYFQPSIFLCTFIQLLIRFSFKHNIHH